MFSFFFWCISIQIDIITSHFQNYSDFLKVSLYNSLFILYYRYMASITAQQLTKYYETYGTTEVVFSKEVIRTLGLDPRQVYIKCAEGQWPCIINSASLTQARIVIGTQGGAFQQLAKKDAPPMSLRFCFLQEKGQPMSFFVTCKVGQITAYMNSKEYVIVTLAFTQRPPEDLIQILGNVVDANTNFNEKKDERIHITPDALRKLGIPKKECMINIQDVPRRCILQEISFGGAKICILGVAKFLKGKIAHLSLEVDNPYEVIQLIGTIAETGAVENRSDIVVAEIQYDEKKLPLSYKLHINNYLTTVRKSDMNTKFADAAPQPEEEEATPFAEEEMDV